MPIPPYAQWMLEQESRALLTRLALVKPFVLQESMLPAAGLLPRSQMAIENYLTGGRRHLKALVHRYLGWLGSPEALLADAEERSAGSPSCASVQRRADAVRSFQQTSSRSAVKTKPASGYPGWMWYRRTLCSSGTVTTTLHR